MTKMKILITLLLAFMFVSNVYAEDSSAHILGNGKVISSFISPNDIEKKLAVMYYRVYYNNQMFHCKTGRSIVNCRALKDNPVDRGAVEEQ